MNIIFKRTSIVNDGGEYWNTNENNLLAVKQNPCLHSAGKNVYSPRRGLVICTYASQVIPQFAHPPSLESFPRQR